MLINKQYDCNDQCIFLNFLCNEKKFKKTLNKKRLKMEASLALHDNTHQSTDVTDRHCA